MTIAPNPKHDAHLLSLDFISEAGSYLSTFGAAIAAASGAGDLATLEMAIHHARSNLLEIIAEFKEVAGGVDDK